MMAPKGGQMRFETVSPDDAGMSSERLGWARDMMAAHVESGGSPSAVAVVLRHGRVVFAEAMGQKEPDGPPLETYHVWPIASAGKPVVAATLLSLVEDGLVGLYDPVVDYFPELDADLHGEVLVQHVLTHTTGWESAQRTQRMVAMLMEGAIGEPPPGRDPMTHVFLSAALEPVVINPPGRQQDYDTVTFELIGEIIRRVTGGSLEAAARERILDPLAMSRSAFQVSEDLSQDVVHRLPDLPFGSNAVLSFEGPRFEQSDFGGGGLFVSPADLVAFGQMILNGGELDGVRVLSPATVHSMVTDQIPGIPALFGDRVIPQGSWGNAFVVLSHNTFPYFIGGLVPLGSAAHPGAGGTNFWIDFKHGIVGVMLEVITEVSVDLEPVSGIGHRFQDVITGAIES
ncbi:MAG: CubicO group peptidase (beta-lactamase class C family) [Candidatus Aldehydirespiratoraceae bacterium]|jgi:CubicO group peptidase (beta-lactamase class C family)